MSSEVSSKWAASLVASELVAMCGAYTTYMLRAITILCVEWAIITVTYGVTSLDFQCVCFLQKPSLESVQADVRAFIKDHGLCEGVMPLTQQLREANQRDLVSSIQNHGGSKQVAASMYLQGKPK